MGAFGITDDKWLAWLKRDGQKRVVLVEVDSYVDGVGVVSHYISNHEYITTPNDSVPNKAYDPRLIAWPDFDTRLSELTNGRSTFGYGDLELDNSDGALDSWIEHGWDGRIVRLFLGSNTWRRADFRPILTVVVSDLSVDSRDKLILKVRDRTQSLNAPIQNQLIGGTDSNLNAPIPLCWGSCYNVEPVLISAASHTYQVHDGQISSITQVRDNGLSVAFTPNVAAGTFTLSAQPVGRITADVISLYPTASAMIQHIVTTRSGFVASDLGSSLTVTLAASCPQTLGIYVRDRRNVIDVIDEIVASVGAWWAFDRNGKLCAGRLDSPSGMPKLEIAADDIEENQIDVVRREVPPSTLRLLCGKNWTIQADGLAGAVSEDDRARYARAGGTVIANQDVSAKHPLAPKPDLLDSLLYLRTEAQTEVARRIALRGRVRMVLRLTVFASPLYVQLGDVVKVTHPRFGLAGGQLAIVIALRDRTMEDKVDMEIWL